MSISENMKVLLTPYWIPKMHKSPNGTKFITVNKQCVIKPLRKNITGVIKLFYKSGEKYRNKSKFYSRVNSIWLIQNKKPVIDSRNE